MIASMNTGVRSRNTRRILMLIATGNIYSQSLVFQYFYDDRNQLAKVVDSTGIVIDYTYDPAGNIINVQRSAVPVAPGSLSIFNFNPSRGGGGTQVLIQGQGFSPTATQNTVRFSGVQANVVAATTSSLTVTVPSGAGNGPISVTVGTITATTTAAFTVIPSPTILSLTPKYTVPGVNIASLTATGANLTGAVLSFFPQSGLAVGSVTINPGGTSATMSVTAGSNSVGTYALVATSPGGSSSAFPGPNNTFRVLNPLGDDDFDGLTNLQEVTLGTDPLLADTDGDGYIDGVEVEAGSDPKSPLSTPLTVSPVREAISALLAELNLADPSRGTAPDSSVAIREALGGTLATLNTADPSTGTSPDSSVAIREALGGTLATLNTADPSTGTSPDSSVAIREALGGTLATLNTADPSTGTSPDSSVAIRDALGGTLAALNTADPSTAATPDSAVAIREAVGAMVSVRNTSSIPISSGGGAGPGLIPLNPASSGGAVTLRISLGETAERRILLEGQTIQIVRGTRGGQRAEIWVDGVSFSTGNELLFTVPHGVNQIMFQTAFFDESGSRSLSQGLVFPVAADLGTIVRGKVITADGPISGEQVAFATPGLAAEYFGFSEPLLSLPDLTQKRADSVQIVSAINTRNPGQMFGRDPMGTGIATDWAARYSGWLYVPAPGEYTFAVGVRDGARLAIGGNTIVDASRGGGFFTEREGAVRLEQGWVLIQVDHYQSLGYGELQLSWTPPGGTRQVIPPDFFRTPAVTVKTEKNGRFAFSDVPAALGWAFISLGTQMQEVRLEAGAPPLEVTISLERGNKP